MIERKELIKRLTDGLSIKEFYDLIHDEHLRLRQMSHLGDYKRTANSMFYNYIQNNNIEQPLTVYQLEYVYEMIQSVDTYICDKNLSGTMPAEDILHIKEFISDGVIKGDEQYLSVSEINVLYMLAYFVWNNAMQVDKRAYRINEESENE